MTGSGNALWRIRKLVPSMTLVLLLSFGMKTPRKCRLGALLGLPQIVERRAWTTQVLPQLARRSAATPAGGKTALDGPDLLRRGHLLELAAVFLQLLPLEERGGGGADEPGEQRAEHPERIARMATRRHAAIGVPSRPPDGQRDQT